MITSVGNTCWGFLLVMILGKRREDRLWQRWCWLMGMV